MKEKILSFVKYLLNSLDNSNSGASGKKLTALVVTVAYCYSHRFIDPNNLVLVLTVDAGLITALFGINTYQKTKTDSNG